ncbi:MAG: DUF6879 family protein [Pseudonocardiaceae bacterium]
MDVYKVVSDGSDYRRYLDGEPEPEWACKQPWLDELRAERDSGYYRNRVHVVRIPLGSNGLWSLGVSGSGCWTPTGSSCWSRLRVRCTGTSALLL